MLLVNTFDVEPWWATVPPCVPPSSWDGMTDRSEAPLHTYLDLCDEAGVKCTFFFVGWYARRFPQRVAAVVSRGHEAGCHSLQHEDVTGLTAAQFEANTREARDIIQEAAGVPVLAYRAPSFSWPVQDCNTYLQILAALGFRVDSSISTARRIHGGGFSSADFAGPREVSLQHGASIFEIPVPGVRIGPRDLQLFGGGYLRLTPPAVLNRLARREAYQVMYLHPHDFDPQVPPLPNAGALGNMRRRIKVGDMRRKVLDLFAAAEVRSCGELLARHLARRTSSAEGQAVHG